MATFSSFFRIVKVAAEVVVVLLTVAPPAAEGAYLDRQTCTAALSPLMSCLEYVQNAVATPPPACCTALTQVVQSQPLCLCAILDGDAANWLGVSIDLRRALAVPTACLAQTPSITQCLDVTKILPSPAPSPYNSGVLSDARFMNKSVLGFLLAAASYVIIPVIFWR